MSTRAREREVVFFLLPRRWLVNNRAPHHTHASSLPRPTNTKKEYRRAANAAANNGRERKDLYTDAWDGSEYKGSRWNVLTLLAALFLIVPVAGLGFAYWSYGVLWG